MSKKLSLTAGEMLGRKTVKERVTRLGAVQRTTIASVQRRVEYSERQGSRGLKGDKAGSSGTGVERAALRGWKESVTDGGRKCACCVALYTKMVLGP